MAQTRLSHICVLSMIYLNKAKNKQNRQHFVDSFIRKCNTNQNADVTMQSKHVPQYIKRQLLTEFKMLITARKNSNSNREINLNRRISRLADLGVYIDNSCNEIVCYNSILNSIVKWICNLYMDTTSQPMILVSIVLNDATTISHDDIQFILSKYNYLEETSGNRDRELSKDSGMFNGFMSFLKQPQCQPDKPILQYYRQTIWFKLLMSCIRNATLLFNPDDSRFNLNSNSDINVEFRNTIDEYYSVTEVHVDEVEETFPDSKVTNGPTAFDVNNYSYDSDEDEGDSDSDNVIFGNPVDVATATVDDDELSTIMSIEDDPELRCGSGSDNDILKTATAATIRSIEDSPTELTTTIDRDEFNQIESPPDLPSPPLSPSSLSSTSSLSLRISADNESEIIDATDLPEQSTFENADNVTDENNIAATSDGEINTWLDKWCDIDVDGDCGGDDDDGGNDNPQCTIKEISAEDITLWTQLSELNDQPVTEIFNQNDAIDDSNSDAADIVAAADDDDDVLELFLGKGSDGGDSVITGAANRWGAEDDSESFVTVLDLLERDRFENTDEDVEIYR